MKPVSYHFPWFTTDLTLGMVHRITEDDGTVRHVMMFPKTWEKHGEPNKMTVNHGGRIEEVMIQTYHVIWWEVFDLSFGTGCGGAFCTRAAIPQEVTYDTNPKPKRRKWPWSRRS